MNKYLTFSLIAIAPLLLRAEDAAALVNVSGSENEALLSLESIAEQQEVSEPVASIENAMQEELSYKQMDSPPNVSSVSKERECQPDIQPYQVSVGHIEGKGVGYDTGYTTLEAFFAPAYGKYVPFFDARGHVFDNGKLAANLGLGLRYVWKPEKYLFGLNGYYDYRDTKRGHYNQVSAGFEVFANRYEFRANGYFPVGNKHFQYDKELTGISFKRFEGNNILINEFYDAKVEYAMKGFNAELGAHLIAPRPDYDLFVGAGTYYFIGEFGKNTWGGKIRLSGKVTKYVSLEISDSFDRVFHNRFQGQVIVSYPFGSKKLRPQKRPDSSTCYTDNLMYARAAQPVQRQDIIVVNNKKEPFVIDPIAIDPATGQPFFVVFVDNSNPNVGDGTFENPYKFMNPTDNATNAQTGSAPGNTIYVFPGTGLITTTATSNVITLQTNQRFLGSSISNAYQTTKGLLVIPPQTPNMPHIEYPGGSMTGDFGIKLATTPAVSNNEVSGFFLTSANLPNGEAIGSDSMIGGAIITRNLMDGGTIGIKLGGASGSTVAQGNYIVTENTVKNMSPGGSGSVEGVGIRMRLGNGTALISDNVCIDGTGGASTAGVSGIVVQTYSSPFPIHVDILNNQVNDNENTGVRVLFTSDMPLSGPYTGPICVNVDGNTVNGNGDSGRTGAALVGANAGIAVTSQIGDVSGFSVPHVIINNNIATNNVPYTPPSTMTPIGGGIFVGTTGVSSDLCVRVTNNTSTITLPAAAGGPADFQLSSDATLPSNFYLEPLIGNTGTWFSDGLFIMSEAGDCNCP